MNGMHSISRLLVPSHYRPLTDLAHSNPSVVCHYLHLYSHLLEGGASQADNLLSYDSLLQFLPFQFASWAFHHPASLVSCRGVHWDNSAVTTTLCILKHFGALPLQFVTGLGVKGFQWRSHDYRDIFW